MDKSKERGIPPSVTLGENSLDARNVVAKSTINKKRIFYLSILSVIIATAISFIALFLLDLIHLISNISFYGQFSVKEVLPANNQLGLLVIIVPVLGGLIVGLMVHYGSKGIRGHGIPEAMEKILTNKSKIHPAITYLKPISSAIAIGTGGPFGAEGPIIATGGALGSTMGQIMKISTNERKILLAAGASAGMAAVFGSPIAAVFLAIELLLFEFSPRSIIPVALACITGAAGHHFLFSSKPFFEMGYVATPDNLALAVYSIIGILIGFLSVIISKSIYFIEDMFEKLPLNIMWWPAIGAVAVGVIGYFAPMTLGVGYENITALLHGSLPLQVIVSLCILKFLSWSIALGSGTAGGTLAPLMMIGGAAGSLIGSFILYLFPDVGITIPLAALLGMSAMFAGASRAVLTSIIFAIETTGQVNSLLPLLAACLAAYLISFFFMKHTIMTEKIERRGVQVPDSYESDALGKIKVQDVVQEQSFALSASSSIEDAREWLYENEKYQNNYFIVTDNTGAYLGIVSSSDLYGGKQDPSRSIKTLIREKQSFITLKDTLRTAVKRMALDNVDILPVIKYENGKDKVIGILSYLDLIKAYRSELDENLQHSADINLKRKSLKILAKGQRLLIHWKH